MNWYVAERSAVAAGSEDVLDMLGSRGDGEKCTDQSVAALITPASWQGRYLHIGIIEEVETCLFDGGTALGGGLGYSKNKII